MVGFLGPRQCGKTWWSGAGGERPASAGAAAYGDPGFAQRPAAWGAGAPPPDQAAPGERLQGPADRPGPAPSAVPVLPGQPSVPRLGPHRPGAASGGAVHGAAEGCAALRPSDAPPCGPPGPLLPVPASKWRRSPATTTLSGNQETLVSSGDSGTTAPDRAGTASRQRVVSGTQ